MDRLWDELLDLAHRDNSETLLLERALAGWALAAGVREAAFYLEHERGLERLVSFGVGTFPAQLGEAPAERVLARLPGAFLVGSPAAAPGVDEGRLRALLALAARAARLRRQLREQRFQVNYRGVELEGLYEVGLAIASTLDLDELSEVILLRAVSLLDARRGALYLRTGADFRLAHAIGGDAALVLLGNDPALTLLLAGKAGAPSELLPDATHLLAVPIANDDEVRGLLVVADKESRAGVGPFRAADGRTLGLFANQAAIALENARLHLQALETERLEREMQLAADIQSQLLPKDSPDLAGYEVIGWNRPARRVGGDYFDFLPQPDGRLGLLVGDVSGKGIPAALLVSTLHSAVRLLSEALGFGAELVARLNQHVHAASTSNKFITLLVAALDPESGVLEYVNAGHNPGLVLGNSGTVRTLASGGLPLGLMPASCYRGGSATLEPGDLLCLYSDGITECESPEDEQFGVNRLIELLEPLRARPLAELVTALDAAMAQFSRGLPQGDDQTLVLLRRNAAVPARPHAGG
jgi:phosphoserine phosphatase RsbU/P